MVWTALVPSGMPWLDAELGGFPGNGVFALEGRSGGGKTSFALANAIAALRRGPVCMVTNEAPEAILETALSVFEIDLRPALKNSAFTILSFTPFFVNKVRSLNSVEAPLTELGEFLRERQVRHVVLDTLDPVLSWIEPANAKLAVRGIMAQLRGWEMGVMCTLGAGTPVATEFARTASGSFELADRDAQDGAASQPGSRLIVRHAAWCNVYGAEAAIRLVQGRGFVVSAPSVHGSGDVPRQRTRGAEHARGAPPPRPEEPLFPIGPDPSAYTLIGDPRARALPHDSPERDATLVVSNPSAAPAHPVLVPSRLPNASLERTKRKHDDMFLDAVEAGPHTVRMNAAVPPEDSGGATIVLSSDVVAVPDSEKTIARPPGKPYK